MRNRSNRWPIGSDFNGGVASLWQKYWVARKLVRTLSTQFTRCTYYVRLNASNTGKYVPQSADVMA